ncbi:hypothetical protein [Halorubrum sp. SD690R]|uniref:hypothetical protein n=1 Tax=Halorubrum sp. SD690R TaxID=2518117 RepID=UPI0013052B8B|nr:hypothetical protein [Halorubrum sp. SD690R]
MWFHKAGLAAHAGVTRQTVGTDTDLTCEVVLEEISTLRVSGKVPAQSTEIQRTSKE